MARVDRPPISVFLMSLSLVFLVSCGHTGSRRLDSHEYYSKQIGNRYELLEDLYMVRHRFEKREKLLSSDTARRYHYQLPLPANTSSIGKWCGGTEVVTRILKKGSVVEISGVRLEYTPNFEYPVHEVFLLDGNGRTYGEIIDTTIFSNRQERLLKYMNRVN